MDMQGQRTAWCARAELALAADDPALALEIADRLIASAAHASPSAAGCVPRLWRLRGEALAALGRAADAEAALTVADEAALLRGLQPLHWRIQLSLGRLYQSQGYRKRAEAAFSAARATVADLASRLTDAELREPFVRVAQAVLPRPAAPTPRRAANARFDGLTERERQVAALIAEGQSNRAIAGALVLSERTVATHVSNILAKLDMTTRAQIAAWASEKGLARR
jgi:DNA-binding CsgD family transcriptional regulator